MSKSKFKLLSYWSINKNASYKLWYARLPIAILFYLFLFYCVCPQCTIQLLLCPGSVNRFIKPFDKSIRYANVKYKTPTSLYQSVSHCVLAIANTVPLNE